MDIKDLEELVQPYLEKNGKQFVSYNCKNLLSTGENYGSTMLAVDIKVKDQNAKEEIIKCVAKAVPPTKVVWDFFNVSVSFKKEILHYTQVAPTLREFGREKGIDNLVHFFAECIGARISRNPNSDVVDEDAAFILENLKVKGYTVGDRLTGFNLETTQLVLKDMASLHGAIIAFKLTKPEEFKTKILSNLGKGMVYVPSDRMLDSLVRNVQKYASRCPECVPLLSRVEVGIRKMKNLFVYSKIREPFASLVHTDLWTNNMMIKFRDGKPIHNVFVDFPITEYGSPTRDVIFFLYSSARLDVIKAKLDELIRFYYDQLMETLTKLKCNVDQFSFELFMREMAEVAKDIEFSHIIYMLTPIFTMGGQAKELTEWTPDNLAPEHEETLHENYHKRLHFIILDYARRNWI